MSNVIIVVPTYWTWSAAQADRPVEAIFDHPTPVDGDSTLPRLLESLTALEGPDFDVLILTAVAHPQLEQPAAERVEGIIAPFRAQYPIAQFSADELRVLRERIAAPGFDPEMVSLGGYGPVRNNQLIVPHILGARVIVALDDDETVAPDYLQRATAFVGSQWQGHFVAGVAGLYLERHGEVMRPEGEPTGNIFLDKPAVMNAAIRLVIDQNEALVESPVAYGGNMVFHRELFTRIGFDPWITRGEDIDYLINARLQGHSFWFDKELVITHLPPEAYQSSPYTKLREDVIRFIYEREKLGKVGADPAQFDPYPGRFLRDDVEIHALAALQQTATPADVARMGSPEQILAQARHHAQEALGRYFAFAKGWPRLMDALGGDRFLRDHWQAKMKGS